MPRAAKASDVEALARLLFDAAWLVWRRDGWRAKCFRGVGRAANVQGYVNEQNHVVYLYPEDLDEGVVLEEVLLEEWLHIILDLDNNPPEEHRLVLQFLRRTFPLLDARRKGVLAAVAQMGT